MWEETWVPQEDPWVGARWSPSDGASIPLISGVYPILSIFINGTIFFCNVLFAYCLMQDNTTVISLFFLFSTRETSLENCSIYKSARQRVDSNCLYGKWRLYLMGSCLWPYKNPSNGIHDRLGSLRDITYGHPSIYPTRPTGFNFSELIGFCVFLLCEPHSNSWGAI